MDEFGLVEPVDGLCERSFIGIADIEANGVFGGWLLGPNAGLGWRTVGLGDVNRDAASDVILQNTADGTTVYRDVHNGAWGVVAGPIGADWVAREVAEVTGDGYADVVFQNATSGDIVYADMQGGTLAGWGLVGGNLGTQWLAVA